jgi:hypothetical protein
MISVACTAALLGAGLILTGGGCDTSTPDRQVAEEIMQGRAAAAEGRDGQAKAEQHFQAAASNPGASELISAQAKIVLGQAQYDAAQEALRDVARKDMEAARVELEIGALARQLGVGVAMIDGYKKLDPGAARAELQKRITEAQGGPDKPVWFTHGNSQIPTLAAVTQTIAQLEGLIAQKQDTVKKLQDQRQQLANQAEQFARQAEQQKGNEAVATFTKGSDLRKQAADLAVQIDTESASIIPLQRELSVAQGQQVAINTAISELQQQAKAVDEAWQAVQQQVTQQSQVSKQIAEGEGGAAGAPTSAASTQAAEGATAAASAGPTAADATGKSIIGKAQTLDAILKAANEQRDKALTLLNGALKSFEEANTIAQQAHVKLKGLAPTWPAVQPALQTQVDATNPSGLKLRIATAQRALGDLYTDQVASLGARIRLRDLSVPALNASGVTPPTVLNDPQLDKQQTEAIAHAEEHYKAAEETLGGIIDGPGTSELEKTAKKAAMVDAIFLHNGRARLYDLAGNVDQANQSHKAARDAVALAVSGEATLPPLPGDLPSAIPASATAAPGTEAAPGATTATAPSEGAAPTTAPAEGAPPATAPAEGASPATTPATTPGETPPPAEGATPATQPATNPVGGGPG